MPSLIDRYVEYYVEHLDTFKAHDKDGIAHDEGGIVEGGAKDMQCVQDCPGEYPCHGRPSSYKELYDTFQACCDHHTWWITDCTLPYHDANAKRLTGKWYVKYDSPGVSLCVRDCDATTADPTKEPTRSPVLPNPTKTPTGSPVLPTPPPTSPPTTTPGSPSLSPVFPPPPGPDKNCGGKAEPYDELYETFTECCETHLWWSTDCAAYDENGSGGDQHYSFKYFTDYMTGSCLQDCEPGSEEGSIECKEIPPPVVLYDDVTDCCLGQPWVDISYCASRSVGIYSEGWVVNYENNKCGESYHMKLFILSPKNF